MSLPASYSTVENVQLVLSAIGSVTSINSASIAALIGRGQARVDARLARRFEVPFAGPPPIIETITTDLAAYEILRRLFTAQRMNNSEWPDRFRDADKLLQELADGKAEIVTASGTVLQGRNDVAEIWSSSENYLPTFHEGPIGTQVRDSDKISDLLSERDGNLEIVR